VRLGPAGRTPARSPYRRLRCRSRRPGPVTASGRASRGVRRLDGLYAGRLAARWLHRGLSLGSVSVTARERYRPTVPLSASGAGSSVRVVPLLQSSCAPTPALDLAVERAPTRVSSLFATRPRSVHSPRSVPSPATFRPQAFSASRRLAPLPGSTGLFHPAATSRVHPVQGLLPPCSTLLLSQEDCPLAVGARPLTTPKDGGHARSPRLRGLDPHEEALRRSGVTLAFARSPRRVLSSSRSQVTNPRVALPRLDPLLELPVRSLSRRRSLTRPRLLQRLSVRPPVSSSPT
jgi:hypothetical protein